MASHGLRSGRLGHPSPLCQGEVGPGDGRVVVLEGAVAPNVSSPAAKAWSRCPAGFPPVPEVSTLGIQRGLSRVSWNLSGGPPPEACRGVVLGVAKTPTKKGTTVTNKYQKNMPKTSTGPGLAVPDE